MSIPVVSIPKQGPIATRPRRQSVWDTEGYVAGQAAKALINMFQNATNFSASVNNNVNLTLNKTNPRDTSMQTDGQLPQGQMAHIYGWRKKFRTMDAAVGVGANNGASLMNTQRILEETATLSFLFGNNNVYIGVPMWQVPTGAGVVKPFTTINATTVYSQQQDVERGNVYDWTLNGLPTELLQMENFVVQAQTYDGTQPTPAEDLFLTVQLVSVFFKGIQG